MGFDLEHIALDAQKDRISGLQAHLAANLRGNDDAAVVIETRSDILLFCDYFVHNGLY